MTTEQARMVEVGYLIKKIGNISPQSIEVSCRLAIMDQHVTVS